MFAVALTILAATSVPGTAQILLTHSDTAPTAGTYDISNIVPLSTPLAGTSYSNSNSFTGTGESFTLGGANLALSSLTVEGGNSAYAPDSTLWNVAVYQVGAGNSLTLVTSATALSDTTPPYYHPEPTSWLTFSFSGANAVTLSANTQYAFQITNTNGDNAYFGFANADNSSTPAPTGSAALSFDQIVPNSTTATVLGYNYVFDVGLTAVAAPEPSTYALLLVGCAAMILAVRQRNRSC